MAQASIHSGRRVLVIDPLPYHADLIRYLKTHEAELWAWFAPDRRSADEADAVRLDLLKLTYRLERDAYASLYEVADAAAASLGIDVPLTCYQRTSDGTMNASLAYLSGHAHIIVSGPLIDTLNAAELRWVISHELAHYVLLDRWRDYAIVAQILGAMLHDERARPWHHVSYRLFQLYTEVYCDRLALHATNDLAPAVTALVRVNGGGRVTADAYLRQTAEIFEKAETRATGYSHPEDFVRVRALQLWLEDPIAADARIAAMIENHSAIDELDLLGRERVSAGTRSIIARFLQPAWLQTEAQLAHAMRYFEDFSVVNDLGAIPDVPTVAKSDVRDYYAYVLLDFGTVDRELEDAALAAALLFSDDIGIGESFRRIVIKELNMRKKQLSALESEARDIVARAEDTARA